jgi:hypothetical protein
VGRWLGYSAHAIGWIATCALFGAGLYAGLAPQRAAAPVAERVAGLELAALESRFVENASSGELFVVSGRVRNPGPGRVALQQLALELVDAAGRPLEVERAALRAPAPTALLREAPAAALRELPILAGEIQPGEERAFEVVVAELPDDAAAFRLVESRAVRAVSGTPVP